MDPRGMVGRFYNKEDFLTLLHTFNIQTKAKFGSYVVGDVRALVPLRKAVWSSPGEPKKSGKTVFLLSFLSLISYVIIAPLIIICHDLTCLIIHSSYAGIASTSLYSLIFHLSKPYHKSSQ